MTSSNKYASSKIYKVVDNAYTMCYYGSTTMQLSRRMAKHRTHYRLFGEGKFSRISVFDIFEAHGVHNCKIELVEECPCESKEQLNQREGFHVRSNECVNKNIPGRTLAEWLEDTRDHRLQMALSWQAANPEKVKEADKKYRSNHLQKIKDRAAEKVVCNVCGGAHTHHHTARHKLSKKHVVAEANPQCYMVEHEIGMLNIHDESSEDEKHAKGKRIHGQQHDEEDKAPVIV